MKAVEGPLVRQVTLVRQGKLVTQGSLVKKGDLVSLDDDQIHLDLVRLEIKVHVCLYAHVKLCMHIC
jgi:hypothetical protein